jgi:hypothetical protein
MGDQRCCMQVGDEVWVWYVERLWELARHLPVEELPIQQIEVRLAHFSCYFWKGEAPTGLDMAAGFARIHRADLSYPILLSAEGDLLDGLHRMIKAWALERETIRVVRFPQTPVPDERNPVE